MSLRGRWRDLMGRGMPTGVHRFDGKGDLAHHRFHLRVDSAQKGVLIIDASHLLELNGTALDYVRCVLEGRSDDDMYRYMSHRYRGVDRETAVRHYRQMGTKLVEFIHGDRDVIDVIGPEGPVLGADGFQAPYRMDLILTYRCQNRCTHCYNEPRPLQELTTEQWKQVIDKTWSVGIPHIVFTGGEPTLHPALSELIARSEANGQVTGLVTNGRKLGEDGYLRDLIQKGLDHVQITVLSHREEVHDRLAGDEGAWKETIEGLRVALKEDLYVSTNTTIMSSNLGEIEETMRFLIGLGVKNIAFNGLIRSGGGKSAEGVELTALGEVLDRLKALAEESDVNMVWYTPTPYCELNPINHGLGIKQCTACAINMAVEPDGNVLPCQSYYRPLGNILRDNWTDIWNNQLCKDIRERKYLDGKCVDCGLRETCGGGCPLAREHGDYACLERAKL
jgi:radical SAM protein with 4Fe4S-binding SPASM domain